MYFYAFSLLFKPCFIIIEHRVVELLINRIYLLTSVYVHFGGGCANLWPSTVSCTEYSILYMESLLDVFTHVSTKVEGRCRSP